MLATAYTWTSGRGHSQNYGLVVYWGNLECSSTCVLGKRSCLGEILGLQMTFLFLTSLVQRFDIQPPEGQDSITVTEVTSLTTSPSHFEVRFIPRVKKQILDY